MEYACNRSLENTCGKHPTQKPLAVLSRIILASTHPNDWILDPFTGSSTTGIAANLLGRRFLGIDTEKDFLELSKQRRNEINNRCIFDSYQSKLHLKNYIDSFDFIKEFSAEYNRYPDFLQFEKQ